MAERVINSILQCKQGTAAAWVAANPVLKAGEFGFESDTNKFKIGNGSSAWNSLSYPINPVSASNISGLGTAAARNVSTIGIDNNSNNVVTEAQVKEYCNGRFAPAVFTTVYHLAVDNTQSQPIHAGVVQPAQPATNSNNYLSTVGTTNTVLDFSSSQHLDIDIVSSKVIPISTVSGITVTYSLALNRTENLEFGGRVLISTDNGSTWTALSSNQIFGYDEYSGADDFSVVTHKSFSILLDNPQHVGSIQVGNIIRIQLFKRQWTATALTTRVLAGMSVGGTIHYTTASLESTRMEVSANQIADKAITESKLSDDVAEKLNAVGGGGGTTYTFDTAPTNGSTNPVTSGGVYTALSGKQATLSISSLASILGLNTTQLNHLIALAKLTTVNGSNIDFNGNVNATDFNAD